jgi:HAD superfamily hydrolase (TIGR01509 family)
VNKKFAVFDMDGTLVDSMGYWQRLGREYLASQGITEHVEAVLEQIKAMTMTESAALFIEQFGIPGPPKRAAEEMNAVMERHYRNDIPLKSGAAAYLSALSAQGVQMCVATATPEPLARACLTRLGILDRFQFVLSCDAVSAGKDRPDVFLEAARRLGQTPDRIAVYEDAFFAAQTAKQAGFYTVGVWDDSAGSRWEQLSALTDETIRNWQEAAQAIQI